MISLDIIWSSLNKIIQVFLKWGNNKKMTNFLKRKQDFLCLKIPIHKWFQPIVSVTHHYHAFKVGNKRHKILELMLYNKLLHSNLVITIYSGFLVKQLWWVKQYRVQQISLSKHTLVFCLVFFTRKYEDSVIIMLEGSRLL